MYENILLFDGDIQESELSTPEPSPTPEPPVIDYDQIEDAFYNALYRLDQEQQNRAALSDSDLVEFATGTDARLLTGSTSAAPTSSAQQSAAYLLDIRNVLVLFLFIWFLVTVYSKIKNLLTNYYTNE